MSDINWGKWQISQQNQNGVNKLESYTDKEEKMNGAERIAAERKRQIEKEGWTAEHDAEFTDCELARAAICYCMEPAQDDDDEACPEEWPFNEIWWKPSPKNRIRELEKAGALIAAEIDRLLRLEKREKNVNKSI